MFCVGQQSDYKAAASGSIVACYEKEQRKRTGRRRWLTVIVELECSSVGAVGVVVGQVDDPTVVFS